MMALDSLSADFYRDWFRKEEGDFLVTLRSFLQLCSGTPEAQHRSKLRIKLHEVLRNIALENPANERRVYELLRVPREVQGAETSPSDPCADAPDL